MRVISADRLLRLAHGPDAPFRTPYSVTFSIADIAFEVRTNIAGLVEQLCAKYAAHVSDCAPQFAYYICGTANGYCFWCSHDGGWQWPDGSLPLSAVAFLADATVMSALVHFDGQLRSIHAAAVARSNRGALIVGDSTAGKTTTLLGCARAGLQIYSDERGLLRGTMLQPFLRSCNVREGGRALLLEDERHDALAAYLLTGVPVSLRECFGERAIATPAPLQAVFVLHGSAAHPELTPIDAAAALPSISQWFDTNGDRLDRLAIALNLLRQVHCFRLVLGTPNDSAALIARTLEAQ